MKTKNTIHLFHKRYKTPQGKSRAYWSKVMRRYGNTQKELSSTDWRWRIVTYDDGRRELFYLKERAGGILTGKYPAIYRGIIFPKLIGYGTFAHIKSITLV